MRQPAPTAAELQLLDPDGSFRSRIAADRARIAALAAGNPGKVESAELGHLVHQLAGEAGTFGFAEIGALAIALDDALVEGRPAAEVEPMLARLLAALAEA